MRLTGHQERRSWGWVAVFLFAFLAIGVYIAFDVLDVDGSNLRNPGTAISAEPATSDAERFLHRTPSLTETPGFASSAIAVGFAAESSRLTRRAASATLAARRGRFLPCMRFDQEASSTTASTDDPA